MHRKKFIIVFILKKAAIILHKRNKTGSIEIVVLVFFV